MDFENMELEIVDESDNQSYGKDANNNNNNGQCDSFQMEPIEKNNSPAGSSDNESIFNFMNDAEFLLHDAIVIDEDIGSNFDSGEVGGFCEEDAEVRDTLSSSSDMSTVDNSTESLATLVRNLHDQETIDKEREAFLNYSFSLDPIENDLKAFISNEEEKEIWDAIHSQNVDRLGNIVRNSSTGVVHAVKKVNTLLRLHLIEELTLMNRDVNNLLGHVDFSIKSVKAGLSSASITYRLIADIYECRPMNSNEILKYVADNFYLWQSDHFKRAHAHYLRTLKQITTTDLGAGESSPRGDALIFKLFNSVNLYDKYDLPNRFVHKVLPEEEGVVESEDNADEEKIVPPSERALFTVYLGDQRFFPSLKENVRAALKERFNGQLYESYCKVVHYMNRPLICYEFENWHEFYKAMQILLNHLSDPPIPLAQLDSCFSQHLCEKAGMLQTGAPAAYPSGPTTFLLRMNDATFLCIFIYNIVLGLLFFIEPRKVKDPSVHSLTNLQRLYVDNCIKRCFTLLRSLSMVQKKCLTHFKLMHRSDMLWNAWREKNFPKHTPPKLNPVLSNRLNEQSTVTNEANSNLDLAWSALSPVGDMETFDAIRKAAPKIRSLALGLLAMNKSAELQAKKKRVIKVDRFHWKAFRALNMSSYFHWCRKARLVSDDLGAYAEDVLCYTAVKHYGVKRKIDLDRFERHYKGPNKWGLLPVIVDQEGIPGANWRTFLKTTLCSTAEAKQARKKKSAIKVNEQEANDGEETDEKEEGEWISMKETLSSENEDDELSQCDAFVFSDNDDERMPLANFTLSPPNEGAQTVIDLVEDSSADEMMEEEVCILSDNETLSSGQELEQVELNEEDVDVEFDQLTCEQEALPQSPLMEEGHCAHVEFSNLARDEFKHTNAAMEEEEEEQVVSKKSLVNVLSQDGVETIDLLTQVTLSKGPNGSETLAGVNNDQSAAATGLNNDRGSPGEIVDDDAELQEHAHFEAEQCSQDLNNFSIYSVDSQYSYSSTLGEFDDLNGPKIASFVNAEDIVIVESVGVVNGPEEDKEPSSESFGNFSYTTLSVTNEQPNGDETFEQKEGEPSTQEIMASSELYVDQGSPGEILDNDCQEEERGGDAKKLSESAVKYNGLVTSLLDGPLGNDSNAPPRHGGASAKEDAPKMVTGEKEADVKKIQEQKAASAASKKETAPSSSSRKTTDSHGRRSDSSSSRATSSYSSIFAIHAARPYTHPHIQRPWREQPLTQKFPPCEEDDPNCQWFSAKSSRASEKSRFAFKFDRGYCSDPYDRIKRKELRQLASLLSTRWRDFVRIAALPAVLFSLYTDDNALDAMYDALCTWHQYDGGRRNLCSMLLSAGMYDEHVCAILRRPQIRS